MPGLQISRPCCFAVSEPSKPLDPMKASCWISVSLCVSLSGCLSVYTCLSVRLSPSPSLCVSLSLSIYIYIYIYMYTHIYTRVFGLASRGLESFKSYRFNIVSVGDVRPRSSRWYSWDTEEYTESRWYPSGPIASCCCVHSLFGPL